MAGCCGGKNAGRPISRRRYVLGLAFFATYHVAVHAALVAAGVLMPRLRPVKDFHRQYFAHLWHETWRQEGLTIGGEGCSLGKGEG